MVAADQAVPHHVHTTPHPSAESCGFTAISVEEAERILDQFAPPSLTALSVLLPAALGRVLADDLTSPIDVPSLDCSAMDGFAVASHSARSAVTLRLSQHIFAGEAPTVLYPGTVAAIATGAIVPEGADSIVRKELCQQSGETVHIRTSVVPGQNIRRRAEEVARGESVLDRGTHLGPAQIALAASLGLTALPVYRPLRVAYFSTGNELVKPGRAKNAASRFDTNGPALAALLHTLGCEVENHGPVEDTVPAIKTALTHAVSQADLVITSGGISVGDADYIRRVVMQLGTLRFWRVAMKPGKPVAAADINGTPILCLPGNPVACYVTFCVLAAPLIKRLQGRRIIKTLPIFAETDFELLQPEDVTRYRPARLFVDPSTQANRIALVKNHHAGAFPALSHAHGLVQIEAGKSVSRHERLAFWPFPWIFF